MEKNHATSKKREKKFNNLSKKILRKKSCNFSGLESRVSRESREGAKKERRESRKSQESRESRETRESIEGGQ